METLKGSRYFLKGSLNQNLMEDVGDPSAYPLSSKLMEAFSAGFPIKWKNRIMTFCNQKEAQVASSSRDKKGRVSKLLMTGSGDGVRENLTKSAPAFGKKKLTEDVFEDSDSVSARTKAIWKQGENIIFKNVIVRCW